MSFILASGQDTIVSCTGPKTESRNVSSFYIPRDERFDYIKFSDNKADLVRASAHAIPSKIAAKFSKKTSFESIEEVKKLYAPKGKHVGGINNVLPKKADVSTSDQHPLVFLNELTAPTAVGEKNNILLFPLPQILQGVPSRWRGHPSICLLHCIIHWETWLALGL